MAPFQVGDYLEYSGINVGGTIVCYTIVAPNVQITTSGAPTFIRVEDAIVGIYDGGATSEFGDSRVSSRDSLRRTGILTISSSLATLQIQLLLSQFLPSMSTLAPVKRQKDKLAPLHTRLATFVTSGSGEREPPRPPSTPANMSSALPLVRSSPTTRSTQVATSSLLWNTSSPSLMSLVLFRLSMTSKTSPSSHKVWDMTKTETSSVSSTLGLVLALLLPRPVLPFLLRLLHLYLPPPLLTLRPSLTPLLPLRQHQVALLSLRWQSEIFKPLVLVLSPSSGST
jgi:hypothetical protein